MKNKVHFMRLLFGRQVFACSVVRPVPSVAERTSNVEHVTCLRCLKILEAHKRRKA